MANDAKKLSYEAARDELSDVVNTIDHKAVLVDDRGITICKHFAGAVNDVRVAE